MFRDKSHEYVLKPSYATQPPCMKWQLKCWTWWWVWRSIKTTGFVANPTRLETKQCDATPLWNGNWSQTFVVVAKFKWCKDFDFARRIYLAACWWKQKNCGTREGLCPFVDVVTRTSPGCLHPTCSNRIGFSRKNRTIIFYLNLYPQGTCTTRVNGVYPPRRTTFHSKVWLQTMLTCLPTQNVFVQNTLVDVTQNWRSEKQSHLPPYKTETWYENLRG